MADDEIEVGDQVRIVSPRSVVVFLDGTLRWTNFAHVRPPLLIKGFCVDTTNFLSILTMGYGLGGANILKKYYHMKK